MVQWSSIIVVLVVPGALVVPVARVMLIVAIGGFLSFSFVPTLRTFLIWFASVASFSLASRRVVKGAAAALRTNTPLRFTQRTLTLTPRTLTPVTRSNHARSHHLCARRSHSHAPVCLPTFLKSTSDVGFSGPMMSFRFFCFCCFSALPNTFCHRLAIT